MRAMSPMCARCLSRIQHPTLSTTTLRLLKHTVCSMSPHSQPIQSVLSVIIMLTGQCLCTSGVSQFLDEYPAFSDPADVTNYVRQKATFFLNLSDLSPFRSLTMRRRTATTQLIAFPRASTIIPVGSPARTVTRPLPWITQPNVSLPAPRPTSSAMANASLPARAPRAKPP
jgi:hypothetical protein